MRSRLIKFIEDFQKNPTIETISSNVVLFETCNKEFYAQNVRLLKYGKRYCSDDFRIAGLKTSVILSCEITQNLSQ
jgi:hypothetical protein